SLRRQVEALPRKRDFVAGRNGGRVSKYDAKHRSDFEEQFVADAGGVPAPEGSCPLIFVIVASLQMQPLAVGGEHRREIGLVIRDDETASASDEGPLIVVRLWAGGWRTSGLRAQVSGMQENETENVEPRAHASGQNLETTV